MESLLVISIFITLLIYILDRESYRYDNKHWSNQANALLFNSVKRKFFLYLFSTSGWIITITSIILADLETLSEGFISYLYIAVPIAIIPQIMIPIILANNRRLLKKSISDSIVKRLFPSNKLSNDCIMELFRIYRNKECIIDESNPDLQQILEIAISDNISDRCLDQLLWNFQFDRFEKESNKTVISERTQKISEYQKVKSEILSRNDAVGIKFRESLQRWYDSQ